MARGKGGRDSYNTSMACEKNRVTVTYALYQHALPALIVNVEQPIVGDLIF